MSAPKGNKYAGSRKGIKNEKTKQWEVFTVFCMEGGLKKFEKELAKLKGKDYTNAFTNLLEFFKPKLARTELSGEVKNKLEIIVRHVGRDNSK